MRATSTTRRRPAAGHRVATWLATLALCVAALIPAGGLALCIDRDHFVVGLLDRSGSGQREHAASRLAQASPTTRQPAPSCPCGSAEHVAGEDDAEDDDHRDVELDAADARVDDDTPSRTTGSSGDEEPCSVPTFCSLLERRAFSLDDSARTATGGPLRPSTSEPPRLRHRRSIVLLI